ncbi:MAG TPA: anti-sigma factor [Gaiellales bacterium]|jgi:anti-sigma-K factor RskA|nr:anti-sigma factor [Gaiellales bacterium]
MSEQLEPELERVARMLAKAGPLPDAPASLRERALAIPDGGSATDESVEHAVPKRRRTWRRPRPLALAGLAAAVAAIAVVPAIALVRDDGGGVHRIDLVPRSFAPEGGGAAQVVPHDDGSSTISLTVWKMPSAGHGRTYEAWLGRTGDRRALGTFHTNASGKATISWRLTQQEVGEYRWLWVTSEPKGGSATPSESTALWGPLT